MVAEDVHWFDPSTLEVLGALLNAAGGRLLVVMTGRPGGWLPAGWPVKVFDLAPLTDEQTDALITALNPGLTADERAAVAARCDGVPFYIEQVVAGLSQTGVPEALYEPLFARLRASAKVVPVVEAAAVIGRQIDRGLLCSVVDLSDDEVDDVIDELEDALVLEPWGTDGWRFRHELLREVAAELAPPSVRRGLHAKVADALIGGWQVEPDWRLVAGHYEQAERFDEAASAYQRASTDARRRGALAEAAHLPDPGPRAARPRHTRPGARPPRDRRCGCERGVLTSAAEGYQSRAAAADFERCLQLGGTDLRDDELFATLAALAGYYVARADLRRAAQVIESLRAGLEQGRQWFRPVIEMLFGVVAWLRGEFDAAVSDLEAATAGLAAADHHDVAALAVSCPTSRSRLPTSTWPWRAWCAAISPAPRPSWPSRHAGPKSSASPRAHTSSPTRCYGDRDAHRGRSARPCRGPGRRPERAGRAARLRRMWRLRGGVPCRPSSAPWPHSAPTTSTRPSWRLTSRP